MKLTDFKEFKTSKRYKVCVCAGIVLAILAGCSIFKGMEGVASACIAGIMTILTTYIWGETKRPSEKLEDNQAIRRVIENLSKPMF